MSNVDNVNEVKCEYFIPMGKPGSLIIKAPVILSNLKISFPANKNLNLNKNCINIKTINNKIFLKTPKIDSNNKLSLDGYIHKSVKYSNNSLNATSEHCIDIDIPINTDIVIRFDQMPIYKESDSTSCFYQKSKPINCNFDSIEIVQDSISNVDCNYHIEMVISLTLTLTQVQNIFIPEPAGNFVLLSDNTKISACDNEEPDNFYCVVGCDQNKGLIANKKKMGSSELTCN